MQPSEKLFTYYSSLSEKIRGGENFAQHKREPLHFWGQTLIEFKMADLNVRAVADGNCSVRVIFFIKQNLLPSKTP